MDKYFLKGGTHYYELYCSCPNCTENEGNVPRSLWHCESCGGDIYVGCNAHLYCKECGRERHIMHSAFKCPLCCKVEDEVIDLNDVSECPHIQNYNIMRQMVRSVGIPWLVSLLKNL